MLFSFKIEDQDASQYGHDRPRIAWLPRDPQYRNRPRHRSAIEVRRRQHRRRPAELVRREHLDLHQPLRANTHRSLSDDVRTGRCERSQCDPNDAVRRQRNLQWRHRGHLLRIGRRRRRDACMNWTVPTGFALFLIDAAIGLAQLWFRPWDPEMFLKLIITVG